MSKVIALTIFASYFLFIFYLFGLILKDFFRTTSRTISANKVSVFTALTIVSFGHTWFYMFKFMSWSFSDYERTSLHAEAKSLLNRISSWLVDTKLFEQAWAAVSFGSMNWWWSEQLCLFTGGFWTVFVFHESRRYGIKNAWSYMLLGQVVAISVAANLFHLAILLSPQYSKPKPGGAGLAPSILWIPVLCSLLNVFISPFTNDVTFLPNLLTMHAVLMLPLLLPPARDLFSISYSSLYSTILVSAAVMRLKTTYLAISDDNFLSFLASAFETLHSHPAQSSIGYDIVWTTISFAAWARFGIKHEASVFSLVSAPIVSVGVIAPYVMRLTAGREQSFITAVP
ncbi:uncharacterized protein BT62DRAFT_982794 [Guyanagaster necrorhizus]|uniref:Uncharacterized protein n=1 Tax=Guyanagaster necrorhizus TaxID=856835 RepID=A0A9P8AP05_9AGAR|nr:uncharacterized protein BT62DRAFT_982794 [Guyanagaster necrorhizus MCA 3950]KAG7441382.1 hypothetical protein BT62DRAFT_982794 [Guyanagaster necrorhizus MCA 3950]